jgi:PAS domain S-box-containing protein
MCRLFDDDGLLCVPCQGDGELSNQIRQGAGVVLLTIEALTPAVMSKLMDLMEAQPPWSDLPLVLLGANGKNKGIVDSLGPSLTVLERPTHPLTLLTLVRSALASRRRQYRIRDLLQEQSRLNRDLEQKSLDLERANEALRKEAEERSRAEELNRRLASIVKSSNDAIIGTDVDGAIIAWNEAAERTFGYGPEEIIGRPITILYPPERTGEEDQIFRPVFHGKPITNHETVRLAKDGRRLQVSLRISPIKNSSGAIIGTSGIIRDISERKRAEEELREYMKKLEQSNRNLQDFAFIASHDLSEPLRKIQVFGTLLEAKGADPLGEQERDYVSRMTGAANRMQEILDALLRYSRVDTKGQEFRPVKLDDVVRGATDDLEMAIRDVEAQVEIGPLPTVEGDPHQLRQLLQNLIANALKYHRSEVKPFVKIYGETDDGTGRIFVEDNGIGFDEKYLDKIFQPFQRLHGRNEYPGIGMGLAICRKIIERHKGTITAKSTPGRGSTFIITLPVKRGEQ